MKAWERQTPETIGSNYPFCQYPKQHTHKRDPYHSFLLIKVLFFHCQLNQADFIIQKITLLCKGFRYSRTKKITFSPTHVNRMAVFVIIVKVGVRYTEPIFYPQ